MSDHPSTLLQTIREWLPAVASLASFAVIARVAWILRPAWDDLRTARRLGLLVEGDKKNHSDPRLRHGLLYRIEQLELTNESTAKKIDVVLLRFRAFLRGIGVDASLSDELELEKRVRARVSAAGGRIDIDAIAMRRAMIEEQDRRFDERDERERDVPRIPRPEPRDPRDASSRRMPALERAKNDTPPPALRGRPTGSTAWRNKPPTDPPEDE